MKTKWIASLILASALAAPAFAQVSVYARVGPPPLRYEVRHRYFCCSLFGWTATSYCGLGDGMCGSRSVAPATLRGRRR